MKKLAFLLIFVTLLVALFPAAVGAQTEDSPLRAKLIAGKSMWVGLVEVWNDAENLHIRFVTFGGEGYCLNETHLHVADSLDGIPQKNGNPIPGKFEYKDENLGCAHEIKYAVPLGNWEVGTKLFIAAHAVVFNRLNPDFEETAWGVLCGKIDVYGFPGRNWATYIPYTVQEIGTSAWGSQSGIHLGAGTVFLPQLMSRMNY